MHPDDSKKRTKVLIVDDHPAIREAVGLRIARQPDLEVCGEASDLSGALSLIAITEPDVAIVDISLKNGCGIDLIKRIRDRCISVRILVWSTHSELLYAERSLNAGALGYINKDQATEKIIEGIRRVMEGKVYVSEEITEAMLQRAVGGSQEKMSRSPLDALANRELEVFRLIGQGVKTSQIAERMHLSVKTIETYRERIREKLGLGDGTALAHFATQWMLENG